MIFDELDAQGPTTRAVAIVHTSRAGKAVGATVAVRGFATFQDLLVPLADAVADFIEIFASGENVGAGRGTGTTSEAVSRSDAGIGGFASERIV